MVSSKDDLWCVVINKSCWMFLRTTPPFPRRCKCYHGRAAGDYESLDWQALLFCSWGDSQKTSIGDWGWTLDNIRWPLRAVEPITLCRATPILLFRHPLSPSLFISLSMSFFLSHSLSLCVSLSLSSEWNFCELAACIWSWGNLLVAIRKWCSQSFVILVSDRENRSL